ncbi:MAG: tetratricopeptide repeat protein [Candidatus Omnitrophica bacterium]|nr:tetratricopeptide repeat protein [Candidatus Omnitrophota bacterium]
MKSNHKTYIRDHYQSESPGDIAKRLNIPEKSVRRFIQNIKVQEKPSIPSSPLTEKSVEKKAAQPSERISWKAILAIIVLGLMVYANSFQGEFIWDDHVLISKNSFIKDLSNFKDVLTSKLGGPEYHRQHGSYRPLQTATYIIDYALWKTDPFGYHLTNILLHLLASIALYIMLFVLLANNRIAAITALLFVVHPVHTEAVSYISGRADSLSAIFLILSFLFYVQCCRKNVGFIIPLVLSYTLALLSKENALMILLFIGAYHYALNRKIKWAPLLAVVCLSGCYVLLRAAGALGQLGLIEAVPTTLAERIPGFFVALTAYLRLLLFPFHLHMEYGPHTFPFTHPAAAIGAVLSFLIIFSAIQIRPKYPLYSFALLWFILGLLPVSNTFVRLNAFMAEHWLYLPSIGLFLLAAALLKPLHAQVKWRPIANIFLAALICFWGIRTFQQNVYWREPIAFFKRTLEYAPYSVRATSDLAFAYDLKDQYEEAIWYYEKTLAMDPNYADAYNNLGNTYVDVGQYEKAVETLQKALTLTPNASYVYFNLGSAYNPLGKKKEAIGSFEKGLALDDRNAAAYLHLAQTYDDINEYEKAAAVYERLIAKYPSNDDYFYRFGMLRKKHNQFEKAISALETASELNPANADAYTELGITYTSAKQYSQALGAFQKVLSLKQPTAGDYSNLGVAYNNLGEKELAIVQHKRAIELDPAHVAAYNNLAHVYISLKRYEEAVPVLKKALEIDPNYASALNNLGAAYQGLGKEAEAREMYIKSGRRVAP